MVKNMRNVLQTLSQEHLRWVFCNKNAVFCVFRCTTKLMNCGCLQVYKRPNWSISWIKKYRKSIAISSDIVIFSDLSKRFNILFSLYITMQNVQPWYTGYHFPEDFRQHYFKSFLVSFLKCLNCLHSERGVGLHLKNIHETAPT